MKSDEATPQELSDVDRIANALASAPRSWLLRVTVCVLLVYHAVVVSTYTVEVARSRKATEANTRAVEKQTERLNLAIKLLEKVSR